MKRVQDCKVLPGEAVAKEHKVVICTVTITSSTRAKNARISKTRWWRLKEAELRERFVEKAVAEINAKENKSWEETSKVLRETANEVLGKTSGKPGKKEKTCWWCD